MFTTPDHFVRIPAFTASMMIVYALVFDGIGFLLNFLPFIGTLAADISGGIWWLTAFIWFTIRGVRFSDSKKSVALFLGGLVEVIPVLSALPACTLATLRIIAITRAEDALAARKVSLTQNRQNIIERQVSAQKSRTPAPNYDEGGVPEKEFDQASALNSDKQRIPLQNLSFNTAGTKPQRAANDSPNENVHKKAA